MVTTSASAVDNSPELGSPVRENELQPHFHCTTSLEELAESNYELKGLPPGSHQLVDVIDWAAPGSALHFHQSQQRYTTDTLVQPAPPSSERKTALRPTTSPGPQKQRHLAAPMADRGPKFAFGGRDSGHTQSRQIHDSPQVNASLEGPVSKKITKARLAVSKADPWLAEWQPRPKPASSSSQLKEKVNKSSGILTAPPLQWEKTCTLPSLPKVLTNSKGIGRLKKLSNPESSPKPSMQQNASFPASPSSGKAEEEAGNMSPSQKALQRLGRLRDARRTPVQEPSTPKTPSAGSRASAEIEDASGNLKAQISMVEDALTAAAAGLSQASTILATPRRRGHASACHESAQPTAQGPSVLPAAPKAAPSRKPKLAKSLMSRPPNTPYDGPVQGTAESNADGSDSSAGTASLEKCNGCGRTFGAQAFARHSKICAKVFKKECAAYAAEKAASLQGAVKGSGSNLSVAEKGRAASLTVSLSTVSSVAAAPKHKRKEVAAAACEKTGKLPKWKQRSAQLRAAMLAARPGKLGEAVAAFPGAFGEDESLVPCPHCGRRFAELTAERHIPVCKETVHKATRLIAGGGRGAHMRKPVARKGR